MSRKRDFRPRTVELDIAGIGARGDGVARLDGEPVFVPLTVPGDQVLARLEGRRGDGLTAGLLKILRPGPDRVTPPCPLFGRCGGCSLQQLAPLALAAWKRDRLISALARAGFALDLVAPLIGIAPGTRRRASFAFTRLKEAVLLGFNERASHRVLDVDPCLIVSPRLIALLAPLRSILADCLPTGAQGDVMATLTDSGIDLVIHSDQPLDLFARERLAEFADQADLACLSWQRRGPPEPIAQRRAAQIRMADVMVTLPPGGFLQPSREGEATLVALVREALPASGAVADLYAGSGSFSFPIAADGHAVHAVEGEASSLAALSAAARLSRARISTERRDLAERPLLGPELKHYEAVVFDPPRAGAASQAAELAKSGPPVVVAVSCNPATLARDAAQLAGGGYRLVTATPVDQFPWSSHLEAVAVFNRL
jgi:23S rRNA (uracil1939-C5)-methyltransferase